jgi:DNA polymerase alpha subunit A
MVYTCVLFLFYFIIDNSSRNKTLNNGRAEQSEYILLHEFHQLKYVCPDKPHRFQPFAVAEAKLNVTELEERQTGSTNQKSTYQGGLVFEPKSGIWDKYTIVMDFNSLYPSIIQEYNIDFTTVQESNKVEG